jgi:predicted GTPase
VFGRTGAGKSILINNQSGCEFEYRLNERKIKELQPKNIDKMTTCVGHGLSKTLYCLVLPENEDGYSLVDAPGFGDVRSHVHELVH